MINLPVLHRLDITGYGLFPGTPDDEGLHIEFLPGLTLVLGANGLGKTTLVTILYRLLTGPTHIAGIEGRSALGTSRIQPTQLSSWEKSSFAHRVSDGAAGAVARLALAIGAHSLVVERSLRDLRLTQFELDGVQQATNEESFQEHTCQLAGLWSFGDWLLLLRNIVFYFEDRRALVWDPSAQRQLLRFLFLPADIARRWTEDERAILELDTQARNLSAALTRAERTMASFESKAQTAVEVREELLSLERLLGDDTERRQQLDEGLVDLEAARQDVRLRFLKAEQEREARYRDLERAKLIAIQAQFPEESESARYILAQLLTENECLFCGTSVPAVATELESRISSQRCVVCGSQIAPVASQLSDPVLVDQRVQNAATELGSIEVELEEARRELGNVESEHSSLVRELAQLDANIAASSAQIDALIRRLPPEEAELHKQRTELSSLRGLHLTLQAELAEKRKAFKTFVTEQSRAVVERAVEIRSAFDRFAAGFLLEECKLEWSPQPARVGQAGELFDFPAFQIDLAGTDFPSLVRRSGPEDVSESQREFIDLAFRMALVAVAGSSRTGSLVMDAPESSLDTVFVHRAAEVLARFAEPQLGNRLIVTSNLVEGQLIPSLLGLATTEEDRGARLVNLFDLAEPTAAMRELRDEYREALNAMLASVGHTRDRGQTGSSE